MTGKTAAGAVMLVLFCMSCGSAPSVLGGADFTHTENRRGGITILEYRGGKRNIIIPQTVNGLPVNIIGRGAFANKNISSARLPETITGIETGAFKNNRLRNIELPRKLEFIGDEAFRGNGIAAINLPEGITEIGFRAFEKNKLRTLSLPSSLVNLGAYAFARNEIEQVEFSESMDTIPAGGFAYNKIKILGLPDKVKRIGPKAFAGNPVEAVSFWGGEYVGAGAFEGGELKVAGIAEAVRFDSRREMGVGFQSAYQSMGRRSGIYYRRAGGIWWIKEE